MNKLATRLLVFCLAFFVAVQLLEATLVRIAHMVPALVIVGGVIVGFFVVRGIIRRRRYW